MIYLLHYLISVTSFQLLYAERVTPLRINVTAGGLAGTTSLPGPMSNHCEGPGNEVDRTLVEWDENVWSPAMQDTTTGPDS